ITGATAREQIKDMNPEEHARLVVAEAGAERATHERRAALPPAKRIATEVELTALTLEAGQCRAPVWLTADQRESIEADEAAGEKAAAARLAHLSTDQRVAVEALLAILVTTDADWERLRSAVDG